MEQAETLGVELVGEHADAGGVATRPVHAGDESEPDRTPMTWSNGVQSVVASTESAVTSREFLGRRFEMKSSLIALFCAAALLAGCTQTAGTPAPVTAGAPNPPSVTTFSPMAPTANSVTGCILEEGTDRPMTLTVTSNSAVLLTAGGIHYDLNRIRPNVYGGGYWI